MKLCISHLEKIEEKMGGSRFFGGDTIGYVDLVMGFIAYMLPVWEEVAGVKIFDELKFPNLATWRTNFLDHPVIKTDLPPKAKLLTYFRWSRSVKLGVQ